MRQPAADRWNRDETAAEELEKQAAGSREKASEAAGLTAEMRNHLANLIWTQHWNESAAIHRENGRHYLTFSKKIKSEKWRRKEIISKEKKKKSCERKMRRESMDNENEENGGNRKEEAEIEKQRENENHEKAAAGIMANEQ